MFITYQFKTTTLSYNDIENLKVKSMVESFDGLVHITRF